MKWWELGKTSWRNDSRDCACILEGEEMLHRVFFFFPFFSQYRKPTTHRMTPWVRKTFLYWLPRLLMIQRPAEARSLLKSPRRFSDSQDGASSSTMQIATALYLPNGGDGGGGGDLQRIHEKFTNSREVRDNLRRINFILEHVVDSRESADVGGKPCHTVLTLIKYEQLCTFVFVSSFFLAVLLTKKSTVTSLTGV